MVHFSLDNSITIETADTHHPLLSCYIRHNRGHHSTIQKVKNIASEKQGKVKKRKKKKKGS